MTIFTGTSGNTPLQPNGNLPVTGRDLILYAIIGAFCIIAGIGFTVINNHFSD